MSTLRLVVSKHRVKYNKITDAFILSSNVSSVALGMSIGWSTTLVSLFFFFLMDCHECYADVGQRTKPNSGDPSAFPLVPPWGWHLWSQTSPFRHVEYDSSNTVIRVNWQLLALHWCGTMVKCHSEYVSMLTLAFSTKCDCKCSITEPQHGCIDSIEVFIQTRYILEKDIVMELSILR